MNSRGTSFNRGGGRGKGRGRDREVPTYHANRNTNLISVPKFHQVVPGAVVSIVLKEDQPTGREVQGVVGEVLTKGNHPRGIKVRLRDGKVGRVQRMVTDNNAGAKQFFDEAADKTEQETKDGPMAGIQRAAFSPPQLAPCHEYTDFRNDGYAVPPKADASLQDYIVVKKSKAKGKAQTKVNTDVDAVAAPTHSLKTVTTCPVCGEFEGDEVAVAHHVDGHFT